MEKEVLFRGCRIGLTKGDITEFDGDAIVNAANSHLWMGAGVAGAIKRRGGEEIEREAVSQGPVKVGDAVVTGGGRLRARFVIHAAVMGPDLVTSERFIREATTSSLVRADEIGARRVAFPALGTGVGGFPYRSAARAMMEELKLYLEEEESSIQEVVFYLYGDEAYRAFAEVLEEVFA